MVTVLRALSSKLSRIASMSPAVRRERLREKWERWGPHGLALKAAWHIDRAVKKGVNVPYRGRAEAGPGNLKDKFDRVAVGGPFEQPRIQLVNLAAVTLLPEGSSVFEVGGGTGYFASAAGDLRKAKVACSEHDAATRRWAEAHRPHANVTYCDLDLAAAHQLGKFDVVVALEVVEHLTSYGPFLQGMARLAPMAIVSTPNKSRNPRSAILAVPEYEQHVFEWTPGEFYWVLKAFWPDVQLWTIPAYERQVRQFTAGRLRLPVLARAGMWETEEPLIAVCSSPFVTDRAAAKP